MDIWKQIAIIDLTRYANLENSIRSLQEKIAAAENDILLGSSSALNAVAVSGGKAPLEDKYINAIALKGKYESRLKSNILEYRAIRRAVESLSAKDQKILYLAYINRGKLHIETIMNEFSVERSQAYRDKDAALNNFVMAMYCR